MSTDTRDADGASPPAPPPAEIRRVNTQAALAMADLAGALDDMQAVLACCERLLSQLQAGGDELSMESLWATALLSYSRCFAPGPRGTGLTEADLAATGMAGDLAGWHATLLRLRTHFAAPVTNPREQFSVGAAVDAAGAVVGVALTSSRRPAVDDLTVRQTGALAVALSKLLDERIGKQQQVVRTALAALSTVEVGRLPVLEVAEQAAPDGSGDDRPR